MSISPGLVKGASKGEGLGNQFLTNIRETEAIVGYVVRCFENDNIIHVSGKVNPADDIEVINTELALADLDTCERATHRVQKKAKGGDKDAKAELAVLERCLPQLENAGMLRALDLSAERESGYWLPELPDESTMYIATSTKTVLKTTHILTRCVKSRRKKVLLWFRFVLLLKQTLPNWTTKNVTSLCRSLAGRAGPEPCASVPVISC